MMLIGELSDKSGLSRDTTRFYDKQGLIAVGRKERRFNNYKEYSPQTLETLLTIKRIKGFGFTLNEVQAFLELLSANAASCEIEPLEVSQKIAVLETKISELQEMKKLVLSGLSKCQSTCTPHTEICPMLVSDTIQP